MAKKSFESALARLEEITRQLEEGDLSLDKSLKMFDEGVKMARLCNEQLEQARSKVELLLEKNGELETAPFVEEQSGNKDISE